MCFSKLCQLYLCKLYHHLSFHFTKSMTPQLRKEDQYLGSLKLAQHIGGQDMIFAVNTIAPRHNRWSWLLKTENLDILGVNDCSHCKESCDSQFTHLARSTHVRTEVVVVAYDLWQCTMWLVLDLFFPPEILSGTLLSKARTPGPLCVDT